MKNRKFTILSITLAISLVLSYVETLIVILPSIPGIKVGLANIAIVFSLYKYTFKDALIILLIRIFIVATLFGSLVSFMYSLMGGLFSIVTMYIINKTNRFTCIAISVTGGIMHNVGQLLVAMCLLESNVFVYYLPALLISGTITGILTGYLAMVVYKRVDLK